MADARPRVIVGIDEAGYGPTLGPLVVAGTAFEVPDGVEDLWQALDGAVTRKPARHRIPVDDSKALYPCARGLRNLEEGVLPFLAIEGTPPASLRELLARVGPRPRYLAAYPWYRGRKVTIPRDTYATHLRGLASKLAAALRDAGIRFLGARGLPVPAADFNRDLERGNKPAVTFRRVAAIIDRARQAFPEHRIEVHVDRQSGRIRYGRVLYAALRPSHLKIIAQRKEISAYDVVDRAGRAVRVAFLLSGDARSLPVALASMLAKYVRELHMTLFNAFWKECVPGVRPTAGYPKDARRFLAETAAARARLEVEEEILVRRR